jgi:L-aminopeptidase/D-esterase-like protein
VIILILFLILSWTPINTALAAPTDTSPPPSPSSEPAKTGLTAIHGIKVGQHTLSERPTGCTVVVLEAGAVAGVDIRGSSPGTRETALLHPLNRVEKVHAIVLSGGSAFGLATATGVMQYLEERDIGFETPATKVPIVPAAILYDLGVGDHTIRPTADCGYQAASQANNGPIQEGNVGAGAGATVGKLKGAARAMKSGIGTASITLPNGIIIAALVAVNAVGDVIDPTDGQIVAGTRTEDGKGLADSRKLLRATSSAQRQTGTNTTIGVVATNVPLSKVQATKVAQMAHDGLARAIAPVHTPYDGDTVFAVATGTHKARSSVLQIGSLAAEVMAEAIVRAARAATGIPGYPAAQDLQKTPTAAQNQDAP